MDQQPGSGREKRAAFIYTSQEFVEYPHTKVFFKTFCRYDSNT